MFSPMLTETSKGKVKPGPGVIPIRLSPSTSRGVTLDRDLLALAAHDEGQRLAERCLVDGLDHVLRGVDLGAADRRGGCRAP